MKPEMTLSVNPSYFCNFDCSFCYLTKEQLCDSQLIPLSRVVSRFEEVEKYYDIKCIDIYGGEISLLPNEYLENLVNMCLEYSGDINLITNLSKIHPSFYRSEVNLSVSWEGRIRRKNKVVWDNIQSIGRNVNLLMLVGPDMLSWSDSYLDTILEMINSCKNIVSVELKPYSTNQANNYNIKFTDFEEHVVKWLGRKKMFEFVNENNLRSVLSGAFNSFSDDHLYINPNGNLCVLDFDKYDQEYFRELEKFENYLDWANQEKLNISSNSFCSKCEFLGGCLSEHLRDVTSLDHSCNGFYNLISWYRENNFERV